MGKIYISSIESTGLFNSMKIKNILATAIAPFLALPFLALSMQFTPSASAQSRSDCYVEIVGSTTGSRVNLRDDAGTQFRSRSYLLVGQYVNMMNNDSGKRVEDQDTRGNTWYYVEYEPSGTRGWIREDFLSQQCN
jgi:hypothetical protein